MRVLERVYFPHEHFKREPAALGAEVIASISRSGDRGLELGQTVPVHSITSAERRARRSGSESLTPMPGPGLEPGRPEGQEILRRLSPPVEGRRQRGPLPGCHVKTRGIVGCWVQWWVQS